MSVALQAILGSFGFPEELIAAACRAAQTAEQCRGPREERAMRVSAKVVACFSEAGLSESHLVGSTGYGYHDAGREAYEALLARTLDAESALARIQIVSGTHAIVAAVRPFLGPSASLCSLTGPPYDTLRRVLTDTPHHGGEPLIRRYAEVALQDDGTVDPQQARAALCNPPDVVFLQRSRGYAPRPALSVAAIERLVHLARSYAPRAVILVDNCYGEFVEEREPTAAGADLIAGSLIKNPGGGLAPAGAYVAGRREFVERVAEVVVAPHLGRAVGPTLDLTRWLVAGLHRAPRAVAESLAILDFGAALFEELGFTVSPRCGEPRHDIIQAIRLGSHETLCAFTEGLQSLLPVNARARPEPGPVPGYTDPVVMAMGSFIAGSTMELSCDAPLRPPYEVYVQGGLDVTHGMLALTAAANAVVRQAASRGKRIVPLHGR
jgi:cystathionine beta-lyase family protein involved in aluminum resistance